MGYGMGTLLSGLLAENADDQFELTPVNYMI